MATAINVWAAVVKPRIRDSFTLCNRNHLRDEIDLNIQITKYLAREFYARSDNLQNAGYTIFDVIWLAVLN